jgi:coproporphyrinogen III oxidase-like Fe-S oxidoreductase
LESIFTAVSPYVESTGPEITLEINPEDVAKDVTGEPGTLDAIRALGVTRLSVGVQSMNGSAQRILRRCPPDMNKRAVASVKQRFENFSIDLLLGIPGGTLRALTHTMDRVLEFAPPHLSVYCLEPGGVLGVESKSFFDGVDQDRAADEYVYVCARLREQGYHHYEVSNFALPGFESRHNQVYWHGGEYLGIGPGAHSFVAGERFFNVASIDAYVDGGTKGQESIRHYDRRDEDQRRLEDIMLALRTSAGLSIDRIPEGASVVEELVEENLARVERGRVILSDRGFLVLNEIVQRLCGDV